MRIRYKIWCVCLLAWLISCSALAASRYDELCRENTVVREDAAAWIEIPDAKFYQPIMRHGTDDSYYSTHNVLGDESEYGSLFIQASYNAGDFSDPVTVVYGSSKARGAPFRDLQELYSSRFDDCREILIHMPEETIRYKVFAAVPHSSIHILHYFDFNIEGRYNGFFDGVYSTRLLGMHLDEELRPEYGDNVLILSTGIRGDNMQRYLVMAKRIQQKSN